jgi:hypothetical protein
VSRGRRLGLLVEVQLAHQLVVGHVAVVVRVQELHQLGHLVWLQAEPEPAERLIELRGIERPRSVLINL